MALQYSVTTGLFHAHQFLPQCVHLGVDSTRYILYTLLNLAGFDRFMEGQMAITG